MVSSWGELKQQPEERGKPFSLRINCRYTAHLREFLNKLPSFFPFQGDVHPFSSPEEKQLKEEEISLFT